MTNTVTSHMLGSTHKAAASAAAFWEGYLLQELALLQVEALQCRAQQAQRVQLWAVG